MSVAPQELENTVIKCATMAIKCDSEGARGMAITYYQHAVDGLDKLMKLYPSNKINDVYVKRYKTYQNRIETLQKAHNIEPAIDPNATLEEQRRSVQRQEAENDFEDLVMKEKPDITWNQVIGLEDVKKSLLNSIVRPSTRPDVYPIGVQRGMLLHGPPGTGKTMLAAATANEVDGYFINIDGASIMSKWLGEAEKNVSKIFTMARTYAEKEGKPVILFIDEVDSLLADRTSEVGGEVRTKKQFLTEMDGVLDKGKSLMLYVIGATNKPWSLDEAFLRRFEARIYVPLPDEAARQKLFEQYTSRLRTTPQVNCANLAKLFKGYSASDIRSVCISAQNQVADELFNSPDYHEPVEGEELALPREITPTDFKNIMGSRKPSVSHEMIRAYEEWNRNFKAN